MQHGGMVKVSKPLSIVHCTFCPLRGVVLAALFALFVREVGLSPQTQALRKLVEVLCCFFPKGAIPLLPCSCWWITQSDVLVGCAAQREIMIFTAKMTRVIFQSFLYYLPFQLGFKFTYRSGSSYYSGHLDYLLASQLHVKETIVSFEVFLKYAIVDEFSCVYLLLLRPPSFFKWHENGFQKLTKQFENGIKSMHCLNFTAGSF